MPSPPIEHRRLLRSVSFTSNIWPRQRHINVPEWLRYKCLYLLVSGHDEAKSRKLAGTVRDGRARVCNLPKAALEVESLHAREGGADAQVELDTRVNSVCLSLVKVYGVLCGVVDLSVIDSS